MYIEKELDKIFEIEDEEEVITPFFDAINIADLPRGFSKLDVASYDWTTDSRVFSLTSVCNGQ